MKLFWPIVATWLCVCAASGALAQNTQPVDLELVLLVDVSASVNDLEYDLQAQGLAKAVRSERVVRAIHSVARKGIAVCVVQWADHAHQVKSVDWIVLRSADDARQLASRIAAMPRQIHGGHTALGDALAFGLNELQTNAYLGARRVIDLSGDGRSNDGRSLYETRKYVITRGVTINGLAILNELPLLADYFRKQLIGGEGAFVETASDYEDFTHAMSRKLEREILSTPLANSDDGGRSYTAANLR